MFQDISINKLWQAQQEKSVMLIDVRSPSEYNHSTIPGSINIPVFSDDERAEIGTIYKQVSQEAAKERGLEIVSQKLPSFIKQFKQLPPQKKVVFCWRGGMRSKTAATVVDLMGIPVARLEGGMRSFRQLVVSSFENYDLPTKTYSLNGYTGSGKTVILHHLENQGYPVIDLEGMANHRGSIFGEIGLEPYNQTTFESLLFARLQELDQSPYLIFEAESRRIGKTIIPDFLLKQKEKGIQIHLFIPLEERVKNILDDYQPWNHLEECIHAFSLIKKRIHTPIASEIETALQSENYEKAVRYLLEYYYDPRYNHTMNQYPSNQHVDIEAKDTEEAIKKIKAVLEAITIKH
ncbi:tRNA 2-selenouridine(34) synthase MnmH [Aquibacillus salsiterrae]|uniref:tRNA 2-selenouridine(34) synthase MnmH n=1 Tax=Aquibacillus salsiterrae TaxID=2950439 RepID=A0A9X3WCX2_9BACI|nr:tRNA 2-selenouridine(34) synthase MnmH [Aquibacillus salsiterrae]MDC3417252.1 tRNA 2-selenouridine(34) synthase MnmH [Aquibacillus salsiterrae]